MSTKVYGNFPKIQSKDITLSINESGRTVETIRRQEKAGRIISTILMYLIIGFLALLVIFPFYWMIITSLKTNEEVIQPNQTFFPTIVMWSNYVYVFKAFKFLTYLGTPSWWLSSPPLGHLDHDDLGGFRLRPA
jgi:hypothetical protein